MRKLSRQKKLLIVVATTLPLIFLFGIWRSIDLLGTSFRSLMIVCVKKLEMLISYFSHPENFLLIALSGLLVIGFIKGVVFFVSQLYNVHKLKKEFHTKQAKNYLKHIHGIDMLIVEDKRLFALTVGFLQPIIYISSELIKGLKPQELKSVLLHEYYHQANFHPLAKLLMSIFKSFLFFVPVVPSITKQLILRQEALADSLAIEKTSRKSLVSAFLKISQGVNYLTKIPAVVSQFSLRTSRLFLVVEETKVPCMKFPIILSTLSLFIVFFFVTSLAWPITSHAHAQVDNSSELVRGDANVCHGLDQSLFSVISSDQPELNMTIK